MHLKPQSKRIGVSKQDIDGLFKGYEIDYREALREQSNEYKKKSKEINFRDLEYSEEYIDYSGNYYSGSWNVNGSGQIVKPITNPNSFETELVACSHPILPVRLYNNIQTGKEKVNCFSGKEILHGKMLWLIRVSLLQLIRLHH